ncbi:MAG TPA: hypothetical protein VGS13_10580 [Stellaceae bacterium]|nr:hypothetical protein [Stellaceae bacterium]
MSIITNQTITQTVTLGAVTRFPTYASPLTITSTGAVEVNSTIAGVAGILGPVGAAGTVTNLGTVESVGSQGLGIDLLSGGLVTNGSTSVATATITASNNGINVGGAAGTVVNYGTILSTATGANGNGIYLSAGGTVTNLGVIHGNNHGVLIAGGPGTVVNSGGISDTVSLRAGGAITNTATGDISSVHYAIIISGSAGTLSNFGTILVTAATAGKAVYLGAGGTITNSGMIAGTVDGVSISNTSGAVVNLGTIQGTSPSGFQVTGVALFGGSLSNGAGTATAAVISGVQYGAEIGNTAGTVVNFGSIVATAAGGTGLRLVKGGTVDNLGTITGPSVGIFLDTATSVTNGQSGTAKGYIAGQTGIDLNTTGTVTNYGRIVGAATASSVIFIQGGTVHNFGTIAGGTGVDFNFQNAGGIIFNGTSGASAGLISGVSYGVSIETSGGTVTNFATITGGTDGVHMFGTATVVVDNFGTLNGGSDGAYLGGTAGARVFTSGLIIGGAEGVHTRDATAKVTNAGTGTIEGSTGNAIDLTAGGSVINQGRILTLNTTQSAINISGAVGSVSNSGSISGGTGILLGTVGMVTNSGNITGANGHGVAITGRGTVVNQGGIASAAGVAVQLQAGGSVTNKSAGSITGGGGGVYILGAAGSVGNAGTIANSGTANDGIYFSAGGVVTNSGVVRGGFDGIDLRTAGTVTNSGTIIGGGSGNIGGVFLGFNYAAGAFRVNNTGSIISSAVAVLVRGAGSLDNGKSGASGATISGSIGIQIFGVGTVADFGTITGTGGTAISFGGTSANRLILGPGYHLHGTVLGSPTAGATNTLELGSAAGTGTVSSVIATEFVNFGTVKVDAGARWTLTGAGSLGGITLTDFGTLTNTGSIGTTVTLAAGSYLDNKTSGRITSGIGVQILGIGTVADSGTITGTGGTAIGFGGTGANRLILGPGYHLHGTVLGSPTAGATNTLELGSAASTGTVSSVIAAEFVNFGTVKVAAGARWVLATNNAIGAGRTLSLAGTLTDLGTLTNAGVITGGGRLIVDPATLVNSGSVGVSVTLAGGGTLANKTAGRITAAGNALLGIGGAATVVNQGRITGVAGAGVRMSAGGTVTNGGGGATGAAISGSTGVEIVGTAVGGIVNFGTITGTGGIAISLGTGNDRVVIEKGSVLHGSVANFHPGDSFDLPFMSFSSSGTVALDAGNVLRVVENGGTFAINLDPSQSFTGDLFGLSKDGSTGTLVTESRSPPAPYSISPNPAQVLDNAGQLIFTVTRTNKSGPAVVYASVVDDQGFLNNGDYTFTNDTEVFFAAGVASVKVAVGITDTGAASGSEVFRFIIQQHRTDPASTSLASDKFTITNTTAPAAAAAAPFTFADIAPAGTNSAAANPATPSNYVPGTGAANEQAYAGGPLMFAAPGGSPLAPADGANHHSLLPTLR